MANKPFGIILQEARERQGYSLEDASKYLRIRADILSAIEHCDFENMPARGYARNMIGAYARMLGLNAPALTRQYIQEIDDYQVQVRGGVGSSHGSTYANDHNTVRRTASQQQRSGQRNRTGGQNRSYRGSYSREQRDMSRHNAKSDNRRSTQPTAQRRGANYNRDNRAHNTTRHSRGNAGDNPLVHTRSMQPYGGRAGKNGGPRETEQSGGLLTSLFSSNFTSKLPLLIGAIFFIIVLVFLVTQIVSCVSPKQTTTNTSVPITGVSDTTGQNSNTTNTNSNDSSTLQAPTSCAVTYTVDSGVEVWLEIYENDSTTASVAELVTGPSTAAFTVTGKWKISVPTNSGIKVTVDGTEVELSADTTGYYTYTVDFAKILNEWAQKNKGNTSNTNANSTTS